MNGADAFAFDLDTAKLIVDSVAAFSGVCCRLLAADGMAVYRSAGYVDECTYLRKLSGKAPSCERLHFQGIRYSERLGGRYVYTCPSGLAYCASPIIVGGSIAGGLVSGPVRLVEADDLSEELAEQRQISGEHVSELCSFLGGITHMEPVRLSSLSVILFAGTVCIGDDSRELLRRRGEDWQQREIGQYIHQAKADMKTGRYPIEKEQELFAGVARGDRFTAIALLNELLGHIFYFVPSEDMRKIRITELLSGLSRAAVQGGADTGLVLGLSEKHIKQLGRLHSQEEIAWWTAQAMRQYTDLVFEQMNSKYKNTIRKAISYMQLNCEKKLTLEEVADYVCYSRSHFSKLFKAEMGCGFRTYLNELRVEKSKALLLERSIPISEIHTACGFDSQSYYCKVFKRFVGVTPDYYRKHSRRIDQSRERSSQS